MEFEDVTFRDTQEAFREAIESGRLSRDREKENFVGFYMYMGTWEGMDHFKHSLTRKYLKGEQYDKK